MLKVHFNFKVKLQAKNRALMHPASHPPPSNSHQASTATPQTTSVSPKLSWTSAILMCKCWRWRNGGKRVELCSFQWQVAHWVWTDCSPRNTGPHSKTTLRVQLSLWLLFIHLYALLLLQGHQHVVALSMVTDTLWKLGERWAALNESMFSFFSSQDSVPQ